MSPIFENRGECCRERSLEKSGGDKHSSALPSESWGVASISASHSAQSFSDIFDLFTVVLDKRSDDDQAITLTVTPLPLLMLPSPFLKDLPRFAGGHAGCDI